MRTTVDIAEPLLNNAKKQAERRGVTLSAVIEDALRTMLAARPARPAKKFKLITVGGGADAGLVDPERDINRTSQIIVDEDVELYGQGRQ